MAEFKGTKGKWIVRKADHIGCTNVIFGNEEWDGYVELWHHHSTIKEAEANAKLISKAPELLQTLKDLVDQVEMFTKDNTVASEYFETEIRQAKQLINSATN